MESSSPQRSSPALATLALTVGGLGFLRPAPGTWGSLPPPLLIALMAVLGADTIWQLTTGVILMLLFSFACVYFGAEGERRFGRKDASEVVADETAGVCLPVLAAVWLVPTEHYYVGLLSSFLLFRLFDITKPWPARRLEKLPLGWGVLLDDLAAGVYAALALVVGIHLI
ncbi:MAG: phosphatidylglycerophosphatase A [Xanthomonadales bacterium]|nr:phosphatidylglycerophosphatase A [Xanthomonadales bacterium]